MTGIALHALHYGLLAAGLATVAALVWSVHRGRRDDEHERRVEQLRAGAREEEPPAAPPSAR